MIKPKPNDTSQDIASGFSVMSLLSPTFTRQQFVQQVLGQHRQGYQLLSANQDDEVMGWVL
jgi:hypothetical protein